MESIRIRNKLHIYTRQETDDRTPKLCPYIIVEDLNSLSNETWIAIGNPTIILSKTTLASFVGATNDVEGYFELIIFIMRANVYHRYYVMKVGKMITLFIVD